MEDYLMKSKRFISALLCAIIVFGNGNFVNYANMSVADKLKYLYEAEQTKNTFSEVENALQSELNTTYVSVENEMTNNAVLNGKKYKDYYAGSYVENGELVVCITEGDKKLSIDDKNVRYKIVEYSYNYLQDIYDRIVDKYETVYGIYESGSKEHDLLQSIASIEIRESENIIIVEVKSIIKDMEKVFAEIFGECDCIRFSECNALSTDCDTYRAGRAMYVVTNRTSTSISKSRTSIGYRAYRQVNGKTINGFVSCGHGNINSIDGYVYANDSCTTVIGTVQEARYESVIDASFIKLSDNNKMDLVTYYSNSSGSTSNGDTLQGTNYATYRPVGTTVYKVGSTTYKTVGVIQSTSLTLLVNGISFSNLTRTSSMVESGDSGGLVYVLEGGNAYAIGIVKGQGGSGTSAFSAYTKASVILSEMGIYPY